MAVITPFRALRPAPASASAVAAVPYDVVNTDEARALAAGNPLSFLHVSRAEIDLPPDTNPYDDAVYAKAVENFDTLKARAPLVLEDTPTLYVYRLRMGAHLQTGIAGAFSVDDYVRDVIKKHERTRRDKEDDRTRHIVELRAQTGVVFLTYPDVAAIDAVVREVAAGEPLYDFVAPRGAERGAGVPASDELGGVQGSPPFNNDDVAHTVWRTGLEDTRALVRLFADVPSLYIADGHHRAA